MNEIADVVTLWLAWYRERADCQADTEAALPRRLLRLKMLHASTREEARVEMQQWLERRGLLACDLERLEPSPYGFQFQALKTMML